MFGEDKNTINFTDIADGHYHIKTGKLMELFERGVPLSPYALSELLRKATEQLRKEPTVLNIPTPAVICGNTDGGWDNAVDLLRNVVKRVGEISYRARLRPAKSGGGLANWATLMKPGGGGGAKSKPVYFVFLGNYTGESARCIEWLALLLAYKMNWPKTIHLLRGSAETRAGSDALRNELARRGYDTYTYLNCVTLFNQLPMAAVVGRALLCCHSGLTPFPPDVYTLALLNRRCDPDQLTPFYDLLWANPVDDFQQRADDDVHFVEDTAQRGTVRFTRSALLNFLEQNQLAGLIRAHQTPQYGYSCVHANDTEKVLTVPLMSTVCSRPLNDDYVSPENRGAFLIVSDEQMRFVSIEPRKKRLRKAAASAHSKTDEANGDKRSTLKITRCPSYVIDFN